MFHKLDPELRRRARQHSAVVEASARAAEAKPPSPALVELLVEFTGDVADLVAVGFKPRTLIPDREQTSTIATGTIPVDRLEDLAAIDHVVDTEGPQSYRPLLNYTLPETRADVVHRGTPPRLGEGVVIGVIDSGIDWRHGDFVEADGRTSRILGIWDQMLRAQGTETHGPDDVGVVYTRDQLSRGLQGNENIRTRDTNARGERSGHGTHVAGIAAGNGTPASCCTMPGTYVGVAPAASLIVVRQDYAHDELGENVRVADALDWIFNHPDAAGMPIVVNISLGINRGPHDGTTLVERTIDRIVNAASGRAVVVGAGNFARTQGDEGETREHVRGTVARDSNVVVDFSIRKDHDSRAWVDIWYDRAGELDIDVTGSSGAPSGTVHHGQDRDFVANPADPANRQVTASIEGTINGPHARNNNFRISIAKPQSGNIPTGSWNFKLINRSATPVNFHAWIERGEHAPVFLPSVSPPDGRIRASSDSTISTPATALRAIAVANHQAKTNCCDCSPSHGIVESSGEGPVVRGADANRKPDIAAPGLQVTSAKADAANLLGRCCHCCPDACCCLYEPLNGTSMAAPHVAGAVALMLQVNHALTRDDIVRHLRNSARPAPPGSSENVWGAGFLNVEGAVQRVLAEMGGGGGGGGPAPPFDEGPSSSALWVGNEALPGTVSGDRGSPLSGLREAFLNQSALPESLRILRARLEAIADGPEIAAAVSRHFSEVRRIINTNRRVAVLWHRGDGPRMLRRLIQGANDAEAPAAIACDDQRQYLERWFQLLIRYGSPRLRSAVGRHRSAILELLELPLAAQLSPVAAS